MQETTNLLPASYIFSDFNKAKINVVKDWMKKKYGPEVKQNLRGKWYVKDDKKEDLKCTLTKEEINEEAYNRVYYAAIEEIKEIIR